MACPSVVALSAYPTVATLNGATADNPGNCAPGFHFASLFELHDTSNLEDELARRGEARQR